MQINFNCTPPINSQTRSFSRCWHQPFQCQPPRGRFFTAALQQPSATEATAPAIPETCKRWVARRTGKSFRGVAELVEVPVQQPGAGEVLIRMHWAGINGGCETFRARGEFAFAANRAHDAPGPSASADDNAGFPLGAEGAGVVVAVGPGVTQLQVGQPVAVNGAAAFTEFTVADARFVTPVSPDPEDPERGPGPAAAALALSAVTAAVALEATAGIKAGETVAVTAAAGGTGHFAVQLALIAGCNVIAIVGGIRKVEAIHRLCDRLVTHPGQKLVVLDHKTQDIGQELQLHAPPQGVDVVYEGVGGALRETLLRRLAPGGRLLQVGYISSYPHTQGYPDQLPAQAPPQQHTSSSTTDTGNSSSNAAGVSSRRARALARLKRSREGGGSSAIGTGSDGTTNSSTTHGAADSAQVSDSAAPQESLTATADSQKVLDPRSTQSRQALQLSADGLLSQVPSLDFNESWVLRVPPVEQLFWGGADYTGPQGRRVIGRVWPRSAAASLRARRRVFDLYYNSSNHLSDTARVPQQPQQQVSVSGNHSSEKAQVPQQQQPQQQVSVTGAPQQGPTTVKDTMSLDKQQHVSAPAAGPVSHRRLQVLVDDSIKGLSAIPDAIEYMLRGGHIGKVVVDLRKP